MRIKKRLIFRITAVFMAITLLPFSEVADCYLSKVQAQEMSEQSTPGNDSIVIEENTEESPEEDSEESPEENLEESPEEENGDSPELPINNDTAVPESSDNPMGDDSDINPDLEGKESTEETENEEESVVPEAAQRILLYAAVTEEGNAFLEWEDETEQAVLYRIYRDGILLAELENDGSSNHFYCDASLEAAQEYAYSVCAVNGEEQVVVTGNEARVQTLDAMIITSDYTLSEDLSLFSLTLNGGTLNLNGHVLNVQKDYIQNNAALVFNGGVINCYGDYLVNDYYARVIMNNANDYLYVGGNLTLKNNGGTWYGEYSNGMIEVKGNFSGTTYKNFQPSGCNTVLLSGDREQTISLTDGSYFQTLELQNYSDGGIVSDKGIICKTAVYDRDVNIYIAGQKTDVGHCLEEDVVVDGDYHLGMGTLDLNGHSLTVNGNLYQEGGTINVNGGTLQVQGDYCMYTPVFSADGSHTNGQSAGTLLMVKPEDRVIVEGDFVDLSVINHSGCLTEGILEVKGDFLTDSTYYVYNFLATDHHKVLLSGKGKQTVTFGSSSSTYSHFANVEITNESEEGIELVNLPLVTGVVEDHGNVTKGYIAICSGTSFADNAFFGDVCIKEGGTYSNDIRVQGNLKIYAPSNTYLTANYEIGENLFIGDNGYSTYVYFNGGSIRIKGDFIIGNTYHSYTNFYINEVTTDTLSIGGSMLVKYYGCLYGNNGIIEVGGDIMTTDNGNIYLSGNNKLILNGTEKQAISMSGTFATVELRNYSEEGVYSETVFTRTELIRNGCRLTYGALEGEFGWTLEENQVWEGDLVLLDDVLDLNGHELTIKGDLVQTAGEIRISGGRLIVEGDYRIQSRMKDTDGNFIYGKSSGILRMTAEKDYVLVKGSFITSSAVNHTGCLTDGSMEIWRDFSADSTYADNNFISTGEHIVLFNGTEQQTVRFGASGSGISRFANIENQNSSEGGLVFANENGIYPFVTGQINDRAGNVTGYIAITSDTAFAEDAFSGSICIKGGSTYVNNIKLQGSLRIVETYGTNLSADYEIGGDLIIGDDGYNAYVYFVGGSIQVKGDLMIGSLPYYSAGFYMNHTTTGTLAIEGSVIVKNTGRLYGSKGIIEVGGDITTTDNGTITLSDSNKLILNGTKKQTISMSGAFATVELQNYSEEGIYSENVFTRTELIRNGCRLVYGDIEGEFGWTLEEDRIWEGDLVLIDDVLDLNGHELTIKGDLIQTAGEIRISGGRLIVEEDYRIQSRTKDSEGNEVYGKSSGILSMTDEKDSVLVKGSFLTASALNHNGCLTEGTMEVKGDFIADSTYSGYNFVATGNHKVVLGGDGLQKVSFGISSSDRSHFCMLDITNESEEGVVFENFPMVTGKVSDYGNATKGYLAIVAGTDFGDGSFSGSICMKGNGTFEKDLKVAGSLLLLTTYGTYLSADYEIGETLYIGSNGDYAEAYFRSGNIKVNGDFILKNTSYCSVWFYLNNETTGTLSVKGSIQVGYSGHLYGNNGIIEVGKDFTATDGGTVTLSGRNKVIFSGREKQTVSVPDNCRFGTIELQNYSREGVYFVRNVIRDTFLRNGCQISCGEAMFEFGWTLEKSEIWDGDFILYEDVLDLNGHTLTVTGNFIHMGGIVRVNGGSLNVEGDYRLQSVSGSGENVTYGAGLGQLLMQNENDRVTIHGSLIMQPYSSTSGWFTAGELELYGDFAQLGNNPYLGDGENTVIFTGGGIQTISGKTMTLGNLTNRNPRGLVNNVSITAAGQVKDETGGITGSGTVSVKSLKQIANSVYSGSVTVSAPVELETDLAVGGTLTLSGSMCLNGYKLSVGDLIVNSQLDIDRGIVYCYGSMKVLSGGSLLMQHPEDYVLVNGNFFFNAGLYHIGRLTDGILELRGDFTQSTYVNFIATENYTVILSRKKNTTGRDFIQTIRFQCGIGTVGFNKLVLRKAQRQYHFMNELSLIAKEIVYAAEDTNAPTEVEYLIAEAVTETRVKLTFGGAEDNTGILGYEVYRDGELIGVTSHTFYSDGSVKPATKYTYTVYAFDNDRNLAATSPSLEVTTKADTEAPSAPQGVAMSTRTGSGVTLAWLPAGDNVGVKGYQLYCDGELLVENIAACSYHVRDLERNRIYQFRVAAYDEAGNLSETSEEIEVTVAPPQITKVVPKDKESIGGESAEILVYFKNVGNSVGNKVNIEILGDNDEWQKLNAAPLSQRTYTRNELYAGYVWDLRELAGEKEYQLRITLTDADDNSDVREVSYFVDRQAPAVPDAFAAKNDNGNVVLAWQPSVSADCAAYNIYRGESAEDVALIKRVNGRFEATWTDTGVQSGKTYYYRISAIDQFENISSPSAISEIAVETDKKAPEVKSVLPKTGRIHATVSIAIEAADNREVAKIGLQYRAENDEEWMDVAEMTAEDGKAVYSWNTAGLDDGVYFLNAYAVDASGNRSENEYVRRYEIDNTGIARIIITDTEVASSYVRLDWADVTEEDFAYFQIERVSGTDYEVIDTVSDKLGYYIKNLAPNTKYTFRVVGYDTLGNRGIPSELVAVETIEDTTPPYITEVFPVASYYRDRLSLRVTACDDSAVGKAVFSYSTDNTEFTEVAVVYADSYATKLTLSYDFDLRELPEGPLYVKFEVYDKSGNKNVLTEDGRDIIVTYMVDRTAPARPQDISVLSNEGYVELSWPDAAAQDKDIKAFRIYRADNETGIYQLICKECTTLNYYDTTVKVGETYLYKVAAIDIAGNEGPGSEEVIVTVAEDHEAPVVTGISPKDGDTVGSTPTIKVSAMDNAGLSRIRLEYQSGDNPGIWTLIDTVNARNNAYVANVVWNTDGLAEGKYSIRAIATDSYGNIGEPYIVSCTLDTTAPVLREVTAETGHFAVILHMSCGETEDFSHYEIQRRNVGQADWSTVARTVENTYRDDAVDADTVYLYRVLVYDKWGNQSASDEISGYADTIDDLAPVAILTENLVGLTGMEIGLDGTESSDNIRITEYTWDMGNGDVLKGAQPRYTYDAPGEYRIILTVKDAAGNTAQTATTARIYEKTGRGKSTLHVLDEKGCGIPYALVYLRLDETRSMSLKTDANGYVDIVAETGMYRVAAFQNGYLPAEMDVLFSEYEDKEYTLKLVEDELIVGDLSVRRMTLEEMAEAGVDFSNPDNYNSYVFQVNLTFERRNYNVEYIFVGGSASPAVRYDFGGGGGASVGGGQVYLSGVLREDAPMTEQEPILAYISTTQSISWLKDMYEVELGIMNAADSRFTIVDSMATLQLPAGLSLAATKEGQSLNRSMGDIAGQQRKSVKWIVKGDKRGTYSLTADFKGTLMPFEEEVSAHFVADTEFTVTSGEGIHITVMPEQQAHIGEEYYIHFKVENTSDHPIYNFSTTIGAFTEPDWKYTYINTETGEREEETVEAVICDPSYIDYSVIVQDGQTLTFQTLYPGQAFFGTYHTSFTGNAGDDPEKHYYELTEALVESLQEDDNGVTVSVEPIESHINKILYQVIEIPTFVGDPVDITTGYFTDEMTAMSVNGASTLSFDLSYSSGSTAAAGGMGYGWYSDYEVRLENHNGQIRFYWNPGCSALFVNRQSLECSFYGRRVGNQVIVNSDEAYAYGDYVCLSGGMSDYVLTKREDDTYCMTLPSGAMYFFDAEGRLTKITDAEKHYVELTYREGLTEIREPVSGRKLYLNHNEAGRIVSVSDDMERTTFFAYDANGNLSLLTLPTGDTITYTYDDSHRILTEANALGVFVTNVYDENGRVVRQSDALGNTMLFAYEDGDTCCTVTVTDAGGITKQAVIDANGRITAVVNENGGVSRYSYDAKGNLTVEKDSYGNAVYREYDEKGHLIKLTDKGGIVTLMTYDSAGNVSSVRNEAGMGAAYTYDDSHRMLSSEDSGGMKTTYVYDDNGQLVEQTTRGLGTVYYEYTEGLLTAVTDYNGNVTRTEYNRAGYPVSITDACGNTTRYEYDALGREVCITDACGNKRRFTYDCNGNITSETDELGRTVRYVYDAMGRLLSTELPDGTGEQYSYDGNGNCVRVVHADGTVSRAEYDVCGNVVREIAADGTEQRYEYDLLNRKTAEIDCDGNQVTYEYYPNGNLYKVTGVDGRYELYTYNRNWKVTGITDGNGHTTAYTYDEMGRVTSERNALGEVCTCEYDALGRRTKETDANGNVTRYEYDANSNCIRKTNALGVTTNVVYDPCNRPVRAYIIDKEGTEYSVSYAYDALGRVVSVTEEEGYVTRYAYDGAGNLLSVTDADGRVSGVSEYDGMGRLSAVKDALGNRTVCSYDAAGNLKETAELLSTGARTMSYEYDALGAV